MKNDVICAISTPIGRGAVSIVRISGAGCLDVALKMFSFKGKVSEIQPRFMYLGSVHLDEGDESGLMVFFKAPKSYTGEDSVEFQVHGGVLVAQKVLEKVISSGARLAEAGEFSKRAFLNGKISLDEAESIIDEIDADSESQLVSSLSVSSGKLREKVSAMQDDVEAMIAELEVNIDYPDEVDENKLRLTTKNRLEMIGKDLRKILSDSASVRYLKNGINIALVGCPNVGKSSVMNALLGEERAIVTDVQGTTRDVVSESFLHRGVKINLLDTAGIRETTDMVESLGIEKSKKTLERADVVLLIVDSSETENEEEKKIFDLVQGKNVICVLNKSDKPRKHKKIDGEVEISAKTGLGVEELKDSILNLLNVRNFSSDALILSNERQFEALKKAQEILEYILNGENLTLDIFASQLKNFWLALGKITGKTENEDIINLIFSKFCLGK